MGNNLIQEKPKLKIDWATHKAAKYACQNWHYSKSMPFGKMVKIAVYENDIYEFYVISAVTMSRTNIVIKTIKS